METNLHVIIDVLTQHAEEAAIIWLRRRRAVQEPHFSLTDLSELDAQLDAHLDGLRIAGNAGWAICREEMRSGFADDLFPAAVAAFQSGNEERIGQVLAQAECSDDHLSAVVSALGWLEYEQAAGHIQHLLNAGSTAHRRMGIATAAVHRRDPGEALLKALEDADSALRARALRAVGELGLVERLRLTQALLADRDEECRLWAAWSTALLSCDESALAGLREVVESGAAGSIDALQLLVRRTDAQDARKWLKNLATHLSNARSAVIGAGALGDPKLLPWIIEQMQVLPLARVAGEAFCTITGLDLLDSKLDTDWPAGFSAGPTEDPEDENVDMDADENLAWPDRSAISDWWARHCDQFEPGKRYLLGRPIETAWCEEVLRNGSQRQRAAAALELSLREPGRVLFEVRAPGARQIRQIDAIISQHHGCKAAANDLP